MANPFNMVGSSQFTSSVDAANDSVPFWQHGTGEAFWITNKTFNNIAGAVVGTTDSQTLTNKTLTSPSVSGPTLSGTLTGTYTIGGTPTFPSSVVTLTGSQTLTNKTLTSPTINGGTLSNATVDVDTVAGYTSSTTGTVYGMSVTSGVIASAALAGAVNTAALQTNSVGAANLATNAITLGYAQATSDFSTTSATYVDITGLSVTVTIPAGGRQVKITAFAGNASVSSVNNGAAMNIYDVTASAQLAEADGVTDASGDSFVLLALAVVTPSAGSRTYKAQFRRQSNSTTAHTNGGAGSPVFILVEAI